MEKINFYEVAIRPPASYEMYYRLGFVRSQVTSHLKCITRVQVSMYFAPAGE